MELGNLFFGNSRGEFGVPRTDAWEESIFQLMDKIWKDCSPYGTEYENNVFTMHCYWWGDCQCGADDSDEDMPHAPTCPTVRPNFYFKETGYELRWYKYALRDSYANRNLSTEEFTKMINTCIESIA